jgi:MFS family permease
VLADRLRLRAEPRAAAFAADRLRLQAAPWAVALAATAAVSGIALRVWIFNSRSGALDSDEAVFGLMAKHVVHGDVPIFFWGQAYGGTQETFVSAFLFWIFGVGTTALRFGPLIFWAIATVLLWRIGLRLLDRNRALLAAGLFWTTSSYFVWKSTRAHGFYGSGLAFGLWAMLSALRIGESASPSRLDYAQLGLALGLGWWATPQIAILGVPAVLWVIWKKRSLRGAEIALPLLLIGSAPWWIYNLRHDWASFTYPADEQSKLGHLHNLASAVLPMAFGLRLPSTVTWYPVVAVGLALYVLALLYLIWLVLKRPHRLGMFILALLLFPVFYAFSPYTWLSSEPRYLTLLSPVLALLFVYPFRTASRAYVFFAVCIALAFGSFARINSQNVLTFHSDEIPVPSNFAPVIAELDRLHIDRLYADYWIAYRIDFETDERIVAATGSPKYHLTRGRVRPIPNDDPGSEGRYPKYRIEVDASREAAVLFAHGGKLERRTAPLLRRAGYRHFLVHDIDIWAAPGGASG